MKAVVACAAVCGFAAEGFADWTYDNGKIVDENSWTFDVVEVDGGLEMRKLSANGSTTDLDLSMPVTDGTGKSWAIVTIAGDPYSANLFKNKKIWTSIRLPATLVKVGSWAFENNTAVITLPDEARVKTLETAAFMNSGFTGKVILENVVSLASNDKNGVFYGTRLQDVEFGKDVTAVPSGFIKNCQSMTNFVSRASSLSIASWSMEKCTSLKQYTFNCKPTLNANWNNGGKTGKGVRVFIPEQNADWQTVIGGGSFTPWANCSAADTNTYFTTFGEDAKDPIGYTTSPFAAWLVYSESVAGASLLVTGSPSEYGSVTPAYMEHDGLSASTIPCAAPRYVPDGGYLRECVGWERFAWQDGWVRIGGDTTLAFDYVLEANAKERLCWNWTDAGYAVTIDSLSLPSYASVTTNVAANLEGYYRAGTTVSYTAVGPGFSGWRGVPSGAVFDGATVSFELTEPVAIYPIYRNGWTYDSGKITNGDWTFNVTVEGTGLTIGWAAVVGRSKVIFFDTPVTSADGTAYAIVAVAENTASYFHYNKTVAEVHLPATLERVPDWSFDNCSATITIPENNALKSIGRCAFNKSGFTGKLKLKGDVSLYRGDYSGEGMFYGSGLQDVDFGKVLTVVPGGSLKNCQALTNFVSHAPALRFDDWVLENAVALKQYTFGCYPTFGGSCWNNNAKKGTGVRTFVPRGNAEWKAKMKEATFTPWANSSSAQTNAYFAAFGADAEIPKGYTTSPYATWLLEYDAGAGLKLLFK